MGDINSAYERRDKFENGVIKTSYYVDTFVYDSLEKVAEHLVRSIGFIGVEVVSLYRTDLQSLVNKKQEDYPLLLKDAPVFYLRRETSTVVNASGDGDDLLKLQRIVAEKELRQK